ncbi:unnamed protein product [Durusdinium trenchii]|uniref:Uncharacterized protein n=1 Tax=Durusdinium trenchii TaxID=1381693 RepID=A0ABP0QL00_9DINO
MFLCSEASETLCVALMAQMSHWVKVLGSTSSQTAVPSQYLLLTAQEITPEKLQAIGQDEGCHVILVILCPKEEQAFALRSGLQLLPIPNQVIMAVESWKDDTRQLATDILGNPVTVMLPSERPNAVSLPERKEDDAQLVASFMANILCRSEDRELRAACRALIKDSNRSADEAAETQPASQVGDLSIEQVEDAEFREGIAALMIRHKNMAARSKKVGGKGVKGRKRGREVLSPESKRREPADCEDCSDSFYEGF